MAGRVARNFIESLLSRADIVELIDSYLKLRKAGRNYVACCPFHQEKTPSFSVSAEKQFYHCFGCGASGNALSFLMSYAHLDFVEAVEELASRVGVSVEYEEGTAPQTHTDFSQRQSLYTLMADAAHYYQQQLRQPLASEAVTYLKQRGLTGKIAQTFGIGYAPSGWDNLHKALVSTPQQQNELSILGLLVSNERGQVYDRFRNRVMFPIHDQRGRVIGFGGRVLDNSEPKYLNSPETPLFQKGKELYGWYWVRKLNTEQVIVVEGYMDVIALAQHEIPNVVATLGTATTAEHLSRLFRSLSEIVFCFDGDNAGQKAAWRALELALPFMEAGRQVKFMFLPREDDPDSLVRREGKTGFLQRLAQAPSLPEFFFNQLMLQVDLKNIEGKARLIELAKPLLSKLPSGAYRDLMLRELSRLSHVDLKKLTTLIKSQEVTINPILITPINHANPSLVGSVIQCLLRKPDLVNYISALNILQNINSAELPLLLELVRLLKNHPELNTLGAIYEHWRGSPYAGLLKHYALKAALPLNSEDSHLIAEFQDALKRLSQQAIEARIEVLLHQRDLTMSEKEELKSLLQQKV